MKKIGNTVTPKDHPELESKIKDIKHDWGTGQPLYFLENGCRYTEDELI